jgi:phospholipase C
LTANSEKWKKTLLIITFDEHGGTYDHVDPGWGRLNPGMASTAPTDSNLIVTAYGFRRC